MSFDLTDLLHTLRQTAVERDRQGGHATVEKAQIRDAGLLRLAIPRQHGGLAQPWPDIYRLVRPYNWAVLMLLLRATASMPWSTA